MNKKGFYVYEGRDKITKQLVYIGTTIQKPNARFRWHKSNGKDLDFSLLNNCSNANEMLELEFRLIEIHKPKLNKIYNRIQNLNKKLEPQILSERKGDAEWCQGCLKRRVNKGYKFCNHC